MNNARLIERIHDCDPRAVARAISLVENNDLQSDEILLNLDGGRVGKSLLLGITGPPGVGKSTLTAVLIEELRQKGKRVGVIAIDPSSPLSGGALLGDRIRMMDHALDPNVLVRSMATRGRLGGLSGSAGAAVRIMAAAGCEIVLLETVGVGQSEMDVIRLADLTLMVLAPGFGDDIQAMKAGLLEVADFLVVNKSDQAGAEILTMNMEQIFRDKETSSGVKRVHKTIASEKKGVKTLLEQVVRVARQMTESGAKESRRKVAMELETLDWAIEMLRPGILSAIRTHSRQGEPRLLARNLVEEILKGKSKS